MNRRSAITATATAIVGSFLRPGSARAHSPGPMATPPKGELLYLSPVGSDVNPGSRERPLLRLAAAATNPNHLPIIANGNGMNIHHCVFYNTKLTAVYWSGGSTGHAMRTCLVYGAYAGGVWTSVHAQQGDGRVRYRRQPRL